MSYKEIYAQTQFSPAEHAIVCNHCDCEITDSDVCIEHGDKHYHGSCAVEAGITAGITEACAVCGAMKQSLFDNCPNGCKEEDV